MIRFVGIGGGTGLSVLLRGLKQAADGFAMQADGCSVSAIVCVSDNGGSTGHLRQSFEMPAVGDLRKCLVALADGDRTLADLFQYRFSGGIGLQGHSLGNLIVTALFQMSGSLAQAIDLAKTVLGSKGCILPVTEAVTTLCAELQSGRVIRGESQITAAGERIRRVWLDPDGPAVAGGVLEVLSRADAVILGPGSLYTSIIPNLLVAGVAEAIRHSHALKIFVCNLMTQPGETDGFSAADHLHALENYLGPDVIDLCVFNSQTITPSLRENYLESRSEPVSWDEHEIVRMRIVPVLADLVADEHAKIRHDPLKLASLIISHTRGIQRARDILSGRESLVA